MTHSIYETQSILFTLYQRKEATDQNYLEVFNTTATVLDQIGATVMRNNVSPTKAILKDQDENDPIMATNGKN